MNARAMILSVLAGGSVLVLVSCASGPQADVQAVLEQAGIPGVDANWDGGSEALYLKGAVGTERAREEAEALATTTLAGEGRVVNDLTVEGEPVPLDAQDDLIGAELSRRVALDPTLGEREIQVHVINGAVTITGEVRSADEKDAVGELARRVNGVREIANALEVRSERVAY